MIPILLRLLHHRDAEIVSQCLIEIKKLVQHDPQHATSVIKRIRSMDWQEISSVEPRACIIWMFGEYCSALQAQAPDTLRILLKNFTKEDTQVKQQVLNFAAKMFARIGNRVPVVASMFQYVCKLCSYDLSYDLRDRSRMYEGILLSTNESIRQNFLSLVCCTKPSPIVSAPFDSSLFLGSFSQALNCSIPGHRTIEQWSESPPDASVRGGAIQNDVCCLKLCIRSFCNYESRDGQYQQDAPEYFQIRRTLSILMSLLAIVPMRPLKAFKVTP